MGADHAFELAQKVELFQFVVAPILQMRSIELPDGVTPGATITGRLWWFGLVPSWRHHITIVAIDDHELYTNEHGGPVRTWNHRLTFEPLADGRCRYTDELELATGSTTSRHAPSPGSCFGTAPPVGDARIHPGVARAGGYLSGCPSTRPCCGVAAQLARRSSACRDGHCPTLSVSVDGTSQQGRTPRDSR